MSPELEQAIRERIELGHGKEQIAAELREAGYDNETIEQVYAAVQAAGTAPAAIPAVETKLPGVFELFGKAWQFAISRLDLIAAVAAPTLVIVLLDYVLDGSATMAAGLEIAIAIGVIIGVAIMILLQMTVVHTAVMSQIQSPAPTLSDSFNWARSNFLSWIWIVILTTLVVFGGWALLIVPGIIAAVYVAVAQHVFVVEGVKGLDALQRSRALLTGKFWPLLGRFVGMGLLLILLYIPYGMLIAIFAPEATDVTPLFIGVFEALMAGLVAVLSAHYVAGIYVAVRNNPTNIAPTGWYKAYAWIGVVSFFLYMALIAAIVAAVGMSGFSGMDDFSESMGEEMQLSPEDQAEFEAFMEQFGEELGAGQ